MKQIALLVLLISLSANIFAQRALIDSTFTMTYSGSGKIIRGSKLIYSRSEDNRIDEIKEYLLDEEKGTYYGWGRQRYTYDEFGRLTSEARWDGISNNYDYNNSRNNSYYEYTDFGELSKSYGMKNFMGERIPSGYSEYYYTGERLDSVIYTSHNESTGNYDFNRKESYSYKNGYYEVFSQSFNRNTGEIEDDSRKKCYEKDGKLTKEETSIFYKDSWKENYYTTKYEYTDDGYSTTKYELDKPTTKYEYVFDDHGKQISSKLFFWGRSGDYWSLDAHWQTTIYYSDLMVGNSPIKNKNNTEIYSIDGSGRITISSNMSTTASVYSLSGKLVTNKTIRSGSTTIPVPTGIYIVKCGDVGRKVMVR